VDIPSDDEIRALHERFAPTPAAFDLVHTHCRIVCRIAEQLAVGTGVDLALVRAGCLLHDIGVYRLYRPDGGIDEANYIRHGVLGSRLLRELGLPETLCRFCSCHTGAGITRDDIIRQGLPLPMADYVAETAEEELVMYADKFHSKTTPPTFVPAAAYRRAVAKFGPRPAATFAAMADRYGEPELRSLAAEYGHRLA
jgi:uncharacterized protein